MMQLGKVVRSRAPDERIPPIFFYEDNDISLLPGEDREIHIEFDSVLLKGDRPRDGAICQGKQSFPGDGAVQGNEIGAADFSVSVSRSTTGKRRHRGHRMDDYGGYDYGAHPAGGLFWAGDDDTGAVGLIVYGPCGVRIEVPEEKHVDWAATLLRHLHGAGPC
jgi:hypothetical protein